MYDKDIISVIVPVHNGEKYINHLYANIDRQSFRNLQIIFVENFSKDNSLKCLQAIAVKDSRVTILQCRKKGTSMARKMGVEYANGKYIVFMDQDDKYINKNALEMMYKTIVDTNTSICQFSNYIEYAYGIKKKSKQIDLRTIYSAREVMEKEIGSVFESYGEGFLTPSVWSKIYDAVVLKDAVKNVNIPLYFAEDMFLNTCCFCSKELKNVCIDPNAYYVWNSRFGFSGTKDSGKALIEDYNQVKPLIHQMLMDSCAGEEVIYRLHLESLYFMASYLKSRFDETNLSSTYELIDEIGNMPYIQLAKKYVNDDMDKKRQFEELMFLASDFSPEEFYSRFKDKDSHNKKFAFRNMIKKLLK